VRGITAKRAGVIAAVAGVAAASIVVSGSLNNSSSAAAGWATAQSAAKGGGMSALVAAANKEGHLTLIADPLTWANYGGVIKAFEKKYPKIKVTDEDQNDTSAQEIQAIKSDKGESTEPDAVDVGGSVAQPAAVEGDFAPYKVATWADIPGTVKDSGGLYYGDYQGVITIACETAKLPSGFKCPTTIKGLLKAPKNSVAIGGSPLAAGDAFGAVYAAALANGGSLNNIKPGIDFFQKLDNAGVFNKTQVTEQSVTSGATPITLDWDYNDASFAPAIVKAVGGKVVEHVPTDGVYGGPYFQAISRYATHPAAARLWEEFLYSHAKNGGQNKWLAGAAYPIELKSMLKDKTVNKASYKKLPPINGSVKVASNAQITKATNVLTNDWANEVK